MKMKYLIFGSIAFYSHFARTQDSASSRSFRKVNKTEIEVLYNYYLQDGNHSAVTGGTGTEKLTVYSPGLYLKKSNGRNTYALKGGVDVISSASTDRIDYVVSSASRKDVRGYTQLDFTRSFSDDKLVLKAGGGFSIESDYFSKAIRFGAEYLPENEMQTWFFNIQMLFDDLRWGRLKEPLKLIYPSELRDTEWFDIYTRNTFGLNTGFTRIIGKRNVAGIFLDLSYQSGLLSTPFHRVYFNNDSLVVENLPNSRRRGAIGLKWNTFAGGRTVLKNRIDYYRDDFGITGFGIEQETLIKMSAVFSLGPHIRFFSQKGSRYFAPYREHRPQESYYTSDYDLSKFNTWLTGINIIYSPNNYLTKKLSFTQLAFRYSFYSRSDGLSAHIFSLMLDGVIEQGGKKIQKSNNR